MEPSSYEAESAYLSDSEIIAESDKIAAILMEASESAMLVKARRANQLMRYLVNKRLDGDQSFITSSAIAIDAFSRDPQSDTNDTFVRNIANDLRSRLALFNRDKTRNYWIELPPGGRNGLRIAFRRPHRGNTITTELLRDSECNDAGRNVLGVSPNYRNWQLLPTVTVLPFRHLGDNKLYETVGEVLAGTIIRLLSPNSCFKLTSIMSASKTAKTAQSIDEIRSKLNSDFVLSGNYHVQDSCVYLNFEFCSGEGQLVFAERTTFDINECFSETFGTAVDISLLVAKRLFYISGVECSQYPLKDLKSYSLLLGANDLMHSQDNLQFFRAEKALRVLIERNNNSPVPLSLLAYWHFLAINRTDGYSRPIKSSTIFSLTLADRALQIDRENTVALVAKGAIATYIQKDLDKGASYYDSVIGRNPNDSLALCHKAALLSFADQGEQAYILARKAIDLSPVDPMLYLYQAIAASAADTAEDFVKAEQHAEKSFELNSHHTSTLRMLISIKIELGKREEAINYKKLLLREDPKFSTESYRRRHAVARSESGKRFISNLSSVGL